ncbi:hypothetical protein WS67_00985 [Burkholderia singularis]|uniref:Uncharacterized protein n=1 Tax=Burkholderia singularis TaxID=1503053 RepID=A0A124P839_9BURK|nr:hypothetical protein WS67_00985 [Burkholderia singularis]
MTAAIAMRLAAGAWPATPSQVRGRQQQRAAEGQRDDQYEIGISQMDEMHRDNPVTAGTQRPPAGCGRAGGRLIEYRRAGARRKRGPIRA